MALLGFVLQCAAIAALLGVAASLVVGAAALSLQPWLGRMSPSARSDLAFVASVFPAIAVIAGTAATAAPSIASAVGLGHDHCLHHDHHHHVCFVHAGDISPALALLGVSALAAWLLRAGALLVRLQRAAHETHALEQLGTSTGGRFPIVELPGAPWLCHAVGAFRRRVLLSRALAASLSPSGLHSVLAHEAAHLQRRDPLANLLMSLAGLFAVPVWSRFIQRTYRAAAEQACDDEAAHRVGDGSQVAEALLVVTKLQQAARPPLSTSEAFGFGQHPLEIRVRRLLAGVAYAPRRALGLPAAAGVAASSFAAAWQHIGFIHHAVETALYGLF